MTRARYPDQEGFAENDGVKLFYEVYGEGEPTILLLQTWAIVHSRIWKAQIPFLSRHYRVVTYDGRGNGKADRPKGPENYTWSHYIGDALAVMDATGTEQAILMGVSLSGHLAALIAAHHPERAKGAILIAASAPIGPEHEHRDGSEAFDKKLPTYEGWQKFNAHYWREDYPDFVEFFMGQCVTEPHSTKQIEDLVKWGLETDAETLLDTIRARGEDGGEEVYRSIRCPTLLVHGDQDAIVPVEKSRYLAELCGGRLIIVPGAGHAPQARCPGKMNLIFKEFIDEVAGQQTAASAASPKPAARRRAKRALYLSSPIGLGHGRRDLAIARELRQHHPNLQIDWLAQHPVTALLDSAGERIHPASRFLANESGHIESEAEGHDLHVFEAYRRMDEILVANFMLFQEVVSEEDYDLILGDEAWDVDYFWHEHPELKQAALVWFTDFVGFLPMPGKGERDVFLTTDYNAEMIKHVEGHPGLRDRSIFVGNPDDCVPMTMGPGLPGIREWTEKHFDFCGYITGFGPAAFGPREQLRAELGYRSDEQVVIVSVGGSGVGLPLLRRVIQAYPMAKQRAPALRMIAVAGPRIDPASLNATAGVEVLGFVPDLHRHHAAADLAIVQGGLTTCMELTANQTPFIYVPLQNHFEQNFHVHHRLQRYGAGRRMDFEDCEPDTLAAAIVEGLSKPADFVPVEIDGAARAARMIAELI
ncbi:MAG: alpha/beta fold hydrolase [Gammaproteobacteria bacterium]|nr:alpha/beta fold hydrolase [Gammaproteobacteria bacterium]